MALRFARFFHAHGPGDGARHTLRQRLAGYLEVVGSPRPSGGNKCMCLHDGTVFCRHLRWSESAEPSGQQLERIRLLEQAAEEQSGVS